MPEVFANNSFTTLSGALAAAATELDVAAGTGIRFPTYVSPSFGYAVITRVSDGKREVIQITDRPVSADPDKMTIVRAAQDIDGITAVALDFVSGDSIFATPTKTFYESFATSALIQDGTTNYGANTGTANALAVTLAPVPASIPDGFMVRVKPVANNTGAATLDVNGIGATNINKMVDGTLTALGAGDIDSDDIAVFQKKGSVFVLMNPKVGGASAFAVGTADGELLTNLTLKDTARTFTKTQTPANGTLAIASGVVTWNTANIQDAHLVLSENVTITTMSNLVKGTRYGLLLLQDGTGGRSWVAPAGSIADENFPGIKTGPNQVSIIDFHYGQDSKLRYSTAGFTG